MSDPGATLFAVIGDVHGSWSRLGRVLDAIRATHVHGILLVGDLSSAQILPDGSVLHSPTASRAMLDDVLRRVERLNLPVVWVPGNHDLRAVRHPGNIDGRVVAVRGVSVGGIGGAGPSRFGFPYEWDEDEVRGLPAVRCDVLVTHCPPARTPLDRLHRGGRHVGSEAIRERAEHHDGILLCGHVHEARGVAQVGHCLCVNVGALGDPFGRAQFAVVEIDVGRRLFGGVHYDLDSGTAARFARASPGAPSSS